MNANKNNAFFVAALDSYNATCARKTRLSIRMATALVNYFGKGKSAGASLMDGSFSWAGLHSASVYALADRGLIKRSKGYRASYHISASGRIAVATITEAARDLEYEADVTAEAADAAAFDAGIAGIENACNAADATPESVREACAVAYTISRNFAANTHACGEDFRTVLANVTAAAEAHVSDKCDAPADDNAVSDCADVHETVFAASAAATETATDAQKADYAACLREAAAAHEDKAAESFQRCDTDGFVSQWADGISAQLKRAQADLAEAGNVSEFPCLIDAETGETVDAAEVTVYCKFSYSHKGQWVLSDAAARKYGRKWFPTGARSRAQRKHGLKEGTETAPAKAIIAGSGKGLAGAASCYVAIVRDEG